MEFSKIFQFLEHQVKNGPLDKSLSSKSNSKWVSISSKEFFDQSHKISQALIKLGIKSNDKIALISLSILYLFRFIFLFVFKLVGIF